MEEGFAAIIKSKQFFAKVPTLSVCIGLPKPSNRNISSAKKITVSHIELLDEPRDKEGQKALHHAAVKGESVTILDVIDVGVHKHPKTNMGTIGRIM